jgi:hypothetical protein
LECGEFDRLVESARSARDGAEPQAARVVAAQYEARLTGDQVLAGSATLEIASVAKSPVLLPLEPCNLAVSDPRWDAAEPLPATLGCGGDGKLQALVERAGRLQWQWSLHGRTDTTETLAFQIELPAAAINRFTVDLPNALIPVVDRAVVLGATPAGAGVSRWQIELGGHSRFRLRLAPADGADRRPRLAQVRQSMVYDLSLRGVDIAAQFRVEAHREPLSQLTFTLDPSLRLISALLGDASAAWSVAPSASGDRTQLVLTLPEPIREGVGVVRLKATCPLVLDQPWKLPRIVPEGTFWQEGGAVLLAPEPLVIERLVPLDCRQSGFAALPAPRQGESSQFEYFGPQASVELLLAEHSAPLQSTSGIATELGGGKMTSRVVTDFHAGDAPRFSLEAKVAPQWTIDSLESQPAEALDDWDLQRQGDWRKLAVRLAKPLTPTRPVRLVIVARRLYAAPGRNLGLEDVVPLRFLPADGGKRLVTVFAAGPFELKIAGAERLKCLTAQSLDAAEMDLFGKAPGELLFRDDGTAGLQISLESRRATYAGSVRSEACAVGDVIQENYLFSCLPPKSGGVDRVLVRFSHRRNVAPRWSLANDDEPPAARQWSAEQQAAAGRPPEEETWELTFPRPRTDPLVIRASRETKPSGPQAVSLATLPDVTSQECTLVLRSLGPRPLEISSNRLKPIANAAAPPGQYQTVRGTYRYDPSRDATSLGEPAVVVALVPVPPLPLCWVWNCELQSQFAADGTGQHLISYRLQNAGASHVALTLPPPLTRQDVRGLWIDGSPAPSVRQYAALGAPSPPRGETPERVPQPGSDGNSGDEDGPAKPVLMIDLPAAEKFPTITVHLSTQGDRLRAMGRLQPLLPAIDVPVLAQHWSLWLPPGYEAPRWIPSQQASSVRRWSWSQRLLGPLARPAGQLPFHPFSLDSWSTLFTPGLSAEEVSAEQVRNVSESPASPPGGSWTPVSLPGYEPADRDGWTAYRLPLDNNDAAGVTFVHAATIRDLGLLALLLVIALGAWKGLRRPRLLLFLAGASGLLAMCLPPCVVPIASGVFLGTIGCLVLQLVRRRRAALARAEIEHQDLPSTVIGVVQSVGPLLALAMLFWPAPALAGQAENTAPGTVGAPSPPARKAEPPRAAALRKPGPATYSVLVPADEQQRPFGGKYYLPAALYDELFRRGVRESEKPQGWLIAAAVYRTSLSSEMPSQRLTVDELAADFDLRVFGPATPVRLPFRRDEVKLLPDRALLDGRPVQPEWETSGTALLLDIAEPGRYRLELSFRPMLRGPAPTGFELTVPRLANARLEVTAPTGAPSFEAPSAAGPLRWDQRASRWTAELAPSERLAMRWPYAPGDAAAPAVDVEELLWLKVLPGSVVLDVKLKLKVVAGQLRRLALAADPRLQLLPLAGPDAPGVQVHSPAGQPQIIQLQWSRAIDDATVVDARFLFTQTSSVGNLPLPQLSVLEARPTRRWLALSVDPALEQQVQSGRRLEAVAVPEFLSSWGEAEGPPLMAARLPAGAVDWSLATRPRRPEIVADESLSLSFDALEAEVRFDARLSVASGSVFQHRVSVPPAVQIEKVAVLADGAPRVARWSRDPQGMVTVFLTGPLAGRQDLSLLGRLPVALDKEISLAPLAVQDARAQSSLVHVFRRGAVLVDVGRVAGLADVKPTVLDPQQAESGRLVRSFQADATAAAQLALTVRRNRPVIGAEQIVRMLPQDGAWAASVECRLHVTDGVMDEIRLEKPASWTGPFQVVAPAALKIVETPGEPQRLILRPRSAISGDYQCTVYAPLDASASQPVAVPDVRLEQVAQLRRWVVLPKNREATPISWQTHGLRAARLPKETPQSSWVFEVADPSYYAVFRAAEQLPETPRVRLADIRIAWQPDGGYRGAALFQVEPGKTCDCPLWLPADCRLLGATLGGAPLDPIYIDAGRWLLPIGPDRLPGRIEILFTSGATDTASGTQRGPGSISQCGAQGGWSLTGTASRRFCAPALGDLPVDRTTWTIAGPATFARGVPEDAETLGLNDVEGAAAPAEFATLWQQSLGVDQAAARYGVEGRAESLTLHYGLVDPGGLLGRCTAAVLLVVLAAAVLLLLERGLLWNCFARWPYAFAVVVGLAWWLWLWPSPFGLALVLTALVRQLAEWRGVNTSKSRST